MTYELSEEDLDLLYGCIAAELARCLVADVDNNAKVRAKFEAVMDVGIRLGMEL